MSSLKGDDFFISGLAASHDASQLKGNVVAVDATYYLRLLLDRSHEPLIPAVGGPLALEDCIEVDLNKWKANDCTPFFVFDGCPVKGQDELSLELGRAANVGTNAAWELYNNAQAQPAVETFGLHSGKTASQSLILIPAQCLILAQGRIVWSRSTRPSRASSEDAASISWCRLSRLSRR